MRRLIRVVQDPLAGALVLLDDSRGELRVLGDERLTAIQEAVGVEIDVPEDVFELGLVCVLDALQRDVDEFADVGGVTMRV